MIRILYLIDKLVPAGTQTNLLEIVKRLDRSRFKPYVIALAGGGELFEDFRAAGAEPVVLNVKRVYGPSGWQAFFYLLRWLRENKVDILQCHFLQADILGTMAGRLAGVKKILTARRDEGFWRSSRQLWLNRLLNRASDGVLANSQAVRRAVIRDEGAAPDRVSVIYNGVDVKSYFPSETLRFHTRRGLGITEEEILVGVVANMRHVIKGHSHLIEAIPEILKRAPQVKFLFVGEGDLRIRLEEHAIKQGVRDRILFVGARRDTNALLNAMDIACLPSLSEGFSNSLLEYMAAGKPVVATEVGGNPEVLGPETGFLVLPRSSRALAEKILKIIENPALGPSLGSAAREKVVSHFSHETMIRNYETFYEKLMGPRLEARIGPVSNGGFRICHLIWALEAGGAERQVIRIALEQKKQGHQPTVVCLTRKGALARELEERGVPVFWIRKNEGADFSIIARLSDFLKENDIQILHTHVPTAGLWGRLAAIRAGNCRVVVHEHSDLAAVSFKFRLINRFLNSWTDAYVAVSKHIRDLMVKAGTPAALVSVIPNGILFSQSSAEDGKRIRASLGIRGEDPVIGTVGRLEERKDHAALLEAFKQVKKTLPGARLLLVGDGPLRHALENQARKLGIEGAVYFAGTRQDVTAWLSAFDVFVLSSVTEGISISLLEAMGAAKACVVTRVGGNPEVVQDGTNGVLVPSKNPSALAGALEALLKDPAKASRYGQAAAQSAKTDFSIEAMMGGLDALYRRLLGQKEIIPASPAPETVKTVYTEVLK